MAWIESHQSLGNHPKTKRLVRKLKISKPQAIGHLHLLWWWCLDYAPYGDLSKCNEDDIADGAEWDGEPEQFMEALKYAGFVDEGNTIHDWWDFAGKLLERREKNAQRMRKTRAAHVHDTCGATNQPTNQPTVTNQPSSPKFDDSEKENGQILARVTPGKPYDVDQFNKFYNAYPNHRICRIYEAERHWSNLTSEERGECLAGLRGALVSKEWAEDSGKFVPGMSRWFTERRWERGYLPQPHEETPLEKLERVYPK